MLIHLIRHTTPDIESGICYGQKDLELASSFEQEKDSVHKYLKPQYDRVYSSPLKRCQQLAKTITTNNFSTETDLLEINFGHWEGILWENIPRSESQPWMDDFINIAPPNGESLLQMQQRVHNFIQHHIKPEAHRDIAIVTHAGVIRLFLAWALKIPLHNIFQVQLRYGVIVEMGYQHDDSGATVAFL